MVARNGTAQGSDSAGQHLNSSAALSKSMREEVAVLLLVRETRKSLQIRHSHTMTTICDSTYFQVKQGRGRTKAEKKEAKYSVYIYITKQKFLINISFPICVSLLIAVYYCCEHCTPSGLIPGPIFHCRHQRQEIEGENKGNEQLSVLPLANSNAY